LGWQPRQGLVKVWAKCEGHEPHFMLPRVWESVRVHSLTPPSEFPLWELESRWTPEFLKNDYKSQNPLETFVISLKIFWNVDV